MYNFKNDYSEGAHPSILNKLLATNLEQQMGYGEDAYSIEAKAILRQKMNNADAQIYFVSGGTQSNLLVISYFLRPHEAVISAKTGHIFVHEAGAIEATGHRIISVETADGKLQVTDLEQVLKEYMLRPHVVKPKMVYISNSTEIGTIYKKSELEQIAAFCKANGLFLFMDGARLGQALSAESSDMTLEDVAKLTDVFYIGGTKNGALIGEAIVFKNTELSGEFDYNIKQKGALLAKGRLIGIQFLELFKEDLYFSLAKHANNMAIKIANAAKEKGYSFLTPPATNQIFPILPNEIIEKLSQKYAFYVWKNMENNQAAVRIITSWATDEQKVDEFIEDLKK